MKFKIILLTLAGLITNTHGDYQYRAAKNIVGIMDNNGYAQQINCTCKNGKIASFTPSDGGILSGSNGLSDANYGCKQACGNSGWTNQ